jgi:hypothetical protein
METLVDEHQKIKTSLLKAVSNIQEQKKAMITERIANLPFLSDLPEMKELKKKLIPVKKEAGLPASPKEGEVFKLVAPYTHTRGSDTHPATNVFAPGLSSDLSNPTVMIDNNDISLSVISGQNYGDYYGGYELVTTDVPGLFRTTVCGTISQIVNVQPQPYNRMVKASVTAELPASYQNVVQLVPGKYNSLYRGLVGAEGFLDIYAGQLVGDHDNETNGKSCNFLHSWRDANSQEQYEYQHHIVVEYSFELPANQTQFQLHVIGQLNAYSTLGGSELPPDADLTVRDYSLIDLRSAAHQYPAIFREGTNNSGADHRAPGAIRITALHYAIGHNSVPPNAN